MVEGSVSKTVAQSSLAGTFWQPNSHKRVLKESRNETISKEKEAVSLVWWYPVSQTQAAPRCGGTIPYHRWVLRQTVVVTRRHIFYDVYE